MARTRATVFDAIGSGDPGRVKRYLARDPDALGRRDGDGLSPVMRALYEGRTEIVELLLSRGPKLDVFEAAALDDVGTVRGLLARSPRRAAAYSTDGFTALHLAAYFGGAESARALLERGADVHARSRNRKLPSVTPLHSAAAGRQTEVAAVLLEHGADANATQAGGWTPLHSAAANGNAELVGILLARGAHPRQLSDDRTLPIEFAIENGHRDVVAILQGRKAPRRAGRR